MKYRLEIACCPALYLTEEQFSDLCRAVEMHQQNGFRDGWTKNGTVSIVECGTPAET